MKMEFYLFTILKNIKLLINISLVLKGDYEGITIVNDLLYILRSDGVLFEIKDYQSKN